MRTMRSILALALAVLWMTGCTTWTPTPVNPTLWQHKQMKIGVATARAPQASATKAGSQGLLDVAVNEAMASDLGTHLASLQPTRVPLMATQINARLRALGFQTVRIDEPIDTATLPERDPQVPGFYDRRIEALASRHGVDAILILSVRQWGTIRSYYGFIPLSDPSASFVATGQLIARDGRLLWDEMAAQTGTTGSGEWDQAPDFPNLTHAIREAEDDVMTTLGRNFFETTPQPPKAAAIPVVGGPGTPAPTESGEFDKSAARAALAEAATAAAACSGGGPGGEVDVTVTLAPSGKASSARVEEGPLVGTPTGDCIVTAFQRVTVPPFEGAPVKVRKKMSLDVHP